jgi:hypothetical protein
VVVARRNRMQHVRKRIWWRVIVLRGEVIVWMDRRFSTKWRAAEHARSVDGSVVRVKHERI